MRYPHLAAAIFDQPLLVTPAPLRAFLSLLGPRMGFEVSIVGDQQPAAPMAMEDDDEPLGGGWRGYEVSNGVARIPIHGPIVQRVVTIEQACAGFVATTEVARTFRAAMGDTTVRAIVLDLDCPGGSVAGVFDLADEIYSARGTKPIVAVVNDCAASGGYLIASAADQVVTTQMGLTGSIGVVWAHIDIREAEKMAGVAVTYVFAGDHKIDGWPDVPFTPEMKARFQADIDGVYARFVAAVARGRALKELAVIGTKALTYRGQEGVEAGLADRVGTLEAVMEQLAEESRSPAMQQGTSSSAITAQPSETRMTGKVGSAGAESATQPAAATTAVAELEAAAAGAAAGATKAERARIQGIIGSEEAKGRGQLANHIAFETEMSVDAAKALLAKSAVEQSTKAENKLDAAMRAAGNPAVGPDTTAADGGDEDPNAAAASAVAAYRGRAPAQQRSN